MCDFPNVENNDLELEALSTFCDGWSRRIRSLVDLAEKGYADESLVLCCCYIEAVGRWFCRYESDGKKVFAVTLLRYGRNEVFGRLNPMRLLGAVRRKEDALQWDGILKKLKPSLGNFQDRFHPREEIIPICRSVLSGSEFALLETVLWTGTLAAAAHDITLCDGVHNGSFAMRNGDVTLDFRLFHPALLHLFDRAKEMVMAGRLRKY